MKTANLIIFLTLISLSHQTNFPCIHVFEQDYAVFIYRSEHSTTFLQELSNENKLQRTIHFSCNEFQIPEDCGIQGVTKFLLRIDSGRCVTLTEPVNVEYLPLTNIDQKLDKKVTMILTDANDLKVTIEFKSGDSSQSGFTVGADDRSLNLDIFTESSPVHELKFLKVLKENPIISTIIFMGFGIILCFFGLKFYKDMLVFFIPVMLFILGFYLYLSIVEKTIEQNDKFYLIMLTLLCIMAFVALAITFANVIYFILCSIISFTC